MDEVSKVKVATVETVIALFCDDEKQKRKRRCNWVKSWQQHRSSHEFYSQLLSELRMEKVEVDKNSNPQMTPEKIRRNFNINQ